MKTDQILIIKWKDINYSSREIQAEQAFNISPVEVMSVGYLVEETPEQYKISQTINETGEVYLNSLIIQKKIIIETHNLSQADLVDNNKWEVKSVKWVISTEIPTKNTYSVSDMNLLPKIVLKTVGFISKSTTDSINLAFEYKEGNPKEFRHIQVIDNKLIIQ